METNALCGSLLKWLETFPGREGIAVPQLTDGVVMANVLHQIAPEYFSQLWLVKIKADVGDNWRLKVSNLRKVQQGIVDYYQEQLNQNIKHFPLPDLNKIGEHDDQEELGRMLQLILGCAVNCESKQQYIEAIMNMEENVQKVIMEAIQELMLRESSPGILSGGDGEGRLELGPASFHPQLKTVLEQLESATQCRDETVQRCHELEQQILVVSEEKSNLSTENEKLLNRLDALETGGDLGATTLRYKDLKKQIDGLQDELYKLETSRDEYRTKFDLLERENQEVQTRNEDLQKLADQARSLKDEVDALREMSERAVVYEGTMETYKKKLEELSDLKRQVRILEEKNSDYMQHNMELEEEVKKSGTWRPQLELYKKQVAELHQKLAEEAKKTDRQIFENKKLAEKMEAIIQEKDRLTMERDGLKENIEELRCHVSTLTSPDTTSRPPSDLSDVDLLEIVPHEIRQRLMRLQHENTLLKQRAGEGDSSEQLPVLQTLVSDLQERQASLTQENRWDYKRDFSRHIPNQGGWSVNPPTIPNFSIFDACFNVDPNRKMKVFKKNLKWASESDLLILRQPKGMLSANFLSSTLPLQQPRSLPPLPVTSSSFATQTSKESPIVIRHIHEFKLSPSPTNEDSGCCRTSPSSCEGCDENGCTEDHSHDYSGTLDSGVSGVYAGTLESGISGVYRCLSPVIPSIVEECTTHHVTDILPALGGQRSSSPPVIHHSHPAHTSCVHCCFQNGSQDMNRENGGMGGASIRVSSPCPPRPHTVCSYNPPYKYSHPTSPLPTTPPPPPNLPGSPPVSPLPNASIAPLSLYLPSSAVEVSTIQTTSAMLGSRKTSEEAIVSCALTSSSTTSLTSLTFTTTSPVPVSLSQNRKTCSGLSRPLITPDSPTPHNSPRLPNSINATRSRACRSPSTTGMPSEIASNPIDLPITQTVLVGNVCTANKEHHMPPAEKSSLHPEKSKPVEYNCSDSDIAKYSEHFKSQMDNEASLSSDSTDSQTQNDCKSKTEFYKPSQSKTEFFRPSQSKTDFYKPSQSKREFCKTEFYKPSQSKTDFYKPSQSKTDFYKPSQSKTDFCKTEFYKPSQSNIKSSSVVKKPGIQEVNKKDDQMRTTSCISQTPYAIQPKTRNEKNVQSATDSTKPLNEKIQTFTPGTFYSNRLPTNSKPLVNGYKDDVSTHTPPVRKFSPSQKTSSPPASVSSGITNGNVSPATSASALVIKNEYISKSSTKNSPVVSKHGKESLLHAKPSNHVKFRDPVVTEAIQGNPDNILPIHYSPASPRERVSALPPSKSISSHSESSKDTKKTNNTSGVTLLSDTLFTHFVVSSHYGKKKFEKDVASATDTDTDLETLERKLTLGMYAAPLVSSESCTSVSPDDADGDPSATEYFTDTEEYNPRQFKAFGGEENGGVKPNDCELLVDKIPKEGRNPKFLSTKSLDAAALVRTYSFFRNQTKAKKQRKNSMKEILPTAINGGIVKPKNKTAKHMVSETLNAMFTLCTP